MEVGSEGWGLGGLVGPNLCSEAAFVRSPKFSEHVEYTRGSGEVKISILSKVWKRVI